MKKILIAAPLRQEPDIFEAYQSGLDRLEIPKGFTADRFFVVNDCPEVIPFIRDAAYTVQDYGTEYRKTERDHEWTARNFSAMSQLRNITIKWALANGYDYLFSVDTDLVLQPKTLFYLLAADKPIVSEIFWTESSVGVWCNSWMYDQYDTGSLMDYWKSPGLFPVGMTGACVLIKRSVLEKGVHYGQIPNIRRAMVGEDRHFCVRAMAAGFSIWMDTHAPATHLYTREIFNRWQAENENIGRDEHGETGHGV